MDYEVEKVTPYHPDQPFYRAHQARENTNETTPRFLLSTRVTLALTDPLYRRAGKQLLTRVHRRLSTGKGDDADTEKEWVHQHPAEKILPRGRHPLHGRKTYFFFHGFMIEIQRTTNRLTNWKVPQKIVSSTFRLNSTCVVIYSFIPSMEYTLSFTQKLSDAIPK